MANLTAGQMIDELAVLCGAGGNTADDFRVSLLRYLNWGSRMVWTAYAWPEREKDFFVVTAPAYETGTVTVTNNSAAITGSGTTFTSAMVGRRFALSSSSPWYRILSYSSPTAITLDRVYNEDTASGQAYTIYADEFSLDATLESVASVTLLASGWYGTSTMLEQGEFDYGMPIPTTRGKPRFWTMSPPLASNTSTRRLRLWPVPDDTYSVKVRGLTYWTELTSESDTPVFHQDREPVVLMASALMAQRMGGLKDITSKAEVDMLIKECWANTQRVRPRTGVRRRFDSPKGGFWNRPFGPANP